MSCPKAGMWIGTALTFLLLSASCDGTHQSPVGPGDITVADARKSTCAANPDFHCGDSAVWRIADVEAFGSTGNPMDSNGCMRVTCSSIDDCGPGQECFSPETEGFCYTAFECREHTLNGVQRCMCGGDPNCGAKY